MQLLTTKHFNGYALDCYVEPEYESTGDFWATREQIGTLLGYSQPDASIRVIHQRNSERLDKFSTSINLIRVEGDRTVSRDITVYNFKGLLEICRYSQQDTANAVIDKLWEIADEIRKNGSYSMRQDNLPAPVDPIQGAKSVFEAAKIKDNQLALALDRIYSSYTGRSALQTAGIVLVAPTNNQFLSPTQIGEYFNVSARKINELLVQEGYQQKVEGGYEALERGEPFAVMLDVGKKHGKGTPIRQLKWDSSILEELKEYFPELPF